ncbi:MAG: hypothetical protein CMJ75_07415 [Planctomycetaceae bacterium]|nr:hypothetical protein [Planctomycetaceae bacterium]
MINFKFFEDWLLIPKPEIIIESEIENEIIQKCIRIILQKDDVDERFKKDIQKIKSGVYKISTIGLNKLKELGFI